MAQHRICSNGNASTHSHDSSDLRSSTLIAPVRVGEYLARRLYQLGIRAVHGVPGDHNLDLLDYLDHCGLKWVGNCSELNAAYAADGYARVKAISALFTSFGVGELSALNGIAGAFAESVPVIHVVGVPPTSSQRDGAQLHHALGNGNYQTFAEMSRPLSCAVVTLTDPAEIPTQIDHAIRECWIQSRPVYIALPSDVVPQAVEGDRLQQPIDLSYSPNDPDKEDYVVDVVLRYMQAAVNPIVLVDAGAIRHRALPETHNLVERSGIPTFVSPMGKGAVNEALPNYCGVYSGSASNDKVRERVETADLILSIGALKTDFATPGFTYRVSTLPTINFHADRVCVKYSEYTDLRLASVLARLVARLTPILPLQNIIPGPSPSNTIPPHRRDHDHISPPSFWAHIARWLQPNDIVITEAGIPSFGIWNVRFPPNITAINQVLWSCAGYATPACQGAAIATRELEQNSQPSTSSSRFRTILFTSPTSFHYTAQELSTILRHGLNPIIFLLIDETDPQGSWSYTSLPAAFTTAATKNNYHSVSLHKRQQLHALLADMRFSNPSALQFIEVHLSHDNAPAPTLLTIPQRTVSRSATAMPLRSASANTITKSSSLVASLRPWPMSRSGSASTRMTGETFCSCRDHDH